MSGRRRYARSERGETLVEVLVAVAILGTAGVAVLAGLQLSVTTSDIHRKQSTAGAYVRNYVETVQDWVAEGNYVRCGDPGDYSPSTVGYAVPDRYDAGHDTPVPVAGDGTTLPCGSDAGVQRVRFTLTSEDGRAEEELTVVIRRPCAPGGPGC